MARKEVIAFADELSDAFSTGAYGTWDACIIMLRDRGYDDKEIEAIIRSKWTRWAADESGKPPGRCTAQDLARFLDKQKNIRKQVAGLVA